MQDLQPYQLIIAFAGAFIAGGINTLAGNGSAITLTILTELIGLPGNVANGTNRLGVWTQSAAGTYAFYKNGKLDLRRSWPIILITALGAIGGILLALRVSNEQFLQVFRFLLVFMLLVILVKPARWLRETDSSRKTNWWVAAPFFLALGFYGGFIQMGMGIFFLAVMVLGTRYSIIDSNAVKNPVVALYTILAVGLFAAKGLISWPIGLVMATAQMIGGYLTAFYSSRFAKANLYAYRLLVVIVIFAIVKMFFF